MIGWSVCLSVSRPRSMRGMTVLRLGDQFGSKPQGWRRGSIDAVLWTTGYATWEPGSATKRLNPRSVRFLAKMDLETGYLFIRRSAGVRYFSENIHAVKCARDSSEKYQYYQSTCCSQPFLTQVLCPVEVKIFLTGHAQSHPTILHPTMSSASTASMQFTPEWLKPGRKQPSKQPSFSSLGE